MAASPSPMCAVLLVMLQYAVYVQYAWAYRPHERVSAFTRCSALLSPNQDMLWAADDDDDSVMWECHQSLGTVTGFCLPASDARTVAFSAHLTVPAVGFFWFLSFFFPFQVSFMQVKSRCRLMNFCWHIHTYMRVCWPDPKSDRKPRFSKATMQIMYYYAPEAAWLKNTGGRLTCALW